MDAQNAVESTSAKQPASPRRGSDNESTRPRNRSPVASKTAASTTIATSITVKELKPPPNASTNATDEDATHERDSDAETIVLPGKDGISPSKPRKVIKHEDKSDGEIDDHVLPAPKKSSREAKDISHHGDRPVAADDAASSMRQKKRPLEKQRARDGSAGLSSAPTSPPTHLQREQSSSLRRRNHGNHDSGSDSETPKPRSPRLSKEKGTPLDRHLSHKRKAPKTESDDDAETRKIRRPRVSETGLEGRLSKEPKSASSKPHLERYSASRPRSISPHAHVRAHRRSLSTQLPDKSYASGFGPKKRRIPAPLQSTDYHSDDSSASGSPHPRSSRLKSIVTPGTGDSTMSPAKLAPHKKHLDAHGQTLFAKACAKGEYDVAKTRLAERPEDLNFADHAGNTPLQVASLNGHEDVVELLIGAGCNLECRNDVKDTPLLDAVENGHLGVVKLLLAAGVNPRKANAEGQEPLEKVPDDLDNAEEIRQALIEAKQKVGELRRTSEDHAPNDNQDTSSHGANSPRRSPEPSLGAVLAASSRRGGTVRSTKTSNHLLYMSLDEKTLRSAAARGDHETVTRILQVKESCDDAEALVAAARGGHNFVMELLLALGGANPDPSPVSSLPGEHSTPMLAAIGQENIKVVQLLLEQSGFDPTRRFRGETYYEIAKRREGPMWKEEEHMLKNAYDEYKKTHKGHVKNKVSPSRRERDMAGQDVKRAPRTENSTEKSRLQHKRRPSSPSREGDVKKKVNSAKTVSSPKEKKRSQSFGQNDEQVSPKRGRPKKEDKVPTIAISDREASPALSAKAHPVKPKRSESDMAGSSEGETAKPRRKLISGKDLKGQRDKQRRSSMVSNNSAKDAAERHDSKIEDSTEKPRAERITEKYHDRTKALKRDDSRDRLSPSDASSKRLRASMTPPRHSADDKDDNEAPVKRRKLDADGKENRGLKNPPAEDRPRKRDSSGEPIKRQKLADGDRKDVLKAKKLNRERKESEKASSEKPDSTTASEDVEMRDAPEAPSAEDREAALEKERAESKKRQAELEAAEEEARKKAEAIKQRELEEKQKREAEEKRLQEEADKKRAEEEEKHRLEEAERKRKEEAQAKLEAERLKREEEAKKAREEEERLQKEKEDQRRRQEEERIRLEKEAAEEARRLREEEERRERERKRAARDAELLRQRQEQEREQERLRLSKLPPLLRWLNGCADPKQREYAQLFTIMQGVRYDTINPLATGAQGREQWLLNTQVALLLGEKDLSLQRYTGWEKIPVSNIAKRVIWRLEQDRYALTESKLYHLGEELPDYYGGDPSKVGYQRLEKLRRDASKLFFDMDMFFVKESDLLFVLPTIPHLRNVKLSICYRELPEHENQLNFWTAPAKWKSDPDANAREGFAPRQKYYINGRLDGEDRPGHYKPSTSPFPDQRVPRRGGLTAVGPEEPDYPQLCMEQGLGHLLSEHQKLMVMNAAHLTPRSMTSNDTADGPNGDNMSPSAASPTTRVNGNYERGSPEAPLVNGINGTAH